jgi:8-oxo-dGTP pyrophosphatase MutT (NUDIX family)
MAEAEAAVAIVHTRDAEESVLLIRRAERETDSWSGHWSFPGGRRDPEDADLLDTALRELAEECGIRLAREDMDAALPQKTARRKVGEFIPVAPFVFRACGRLPTVLDSREAVEALWLPLGLLRDPGRHRLRPVPGLPKETLFPAIELNAAPLWGFTYRLITDWLDLVPNAGEPAGFETACELLKFLQAQGLTLEHGWARRGAKQEASLRGAIPVGPVLDRVARARRRIPAVNCVEVRPDRVRVVGLSLEEYVIHAAR